jgi:hypothetical protein
MVTDSPADRRLAATRCAWGDECDARRVLGALGGGGGASGAADGGDGAEGVVIVGSDLVCLNVLECQVSKMASSDTCPRPTTGLQAAARGVRRAAPDPALAHLAPDTKVTLTPPCMFHQ